MAETRTLTMERVFDAPVEKVWAAWSRPEEIAKWWGPKDFGSEGNKIDFQVGGKSVLCMVSPDGQKMYSGGTYKEIVKHQKIVTTDSFMDAEGNIISAKEYGMAVDFPKELVITITFEALGDKTKLTIQHVGLPVGEDADMAEAGWNESLDKLAESLK